MKTDNSEALVIVKYEFLNLCTDQKGRLKKSWIDDIESDININNVSNKVN